MEFNYPVVEILFGAGVIFYLIYYYFTAKFDYWKKRNVKGPKPTPVFGNFKEVLFGKIHNADLFKKFYNDYPNESVIGIFTQRKPALILKDPELIKDVLIRDFNVFSDRGLRVIKEVDPLSQHLVSLEPKKWRPLRQQLSPVFTSGKLKEMFYLIMECADNYEKYVENICEKYESIEVRELTAKFTTDAIGACAFGLNMNSIKDEASEFREIGREMFDSNFLKFVKRMMRDLLPIQVVKLLKPILYNKKMNDFFLNLMRDTIQHRTQNNINRHDFVDLLINIKNNSEKNNIDFNHEILTAQALVFFAAGFETSSTTISNALFELALNPKVQEKLRQEIQSELEKNNGQVTYDSIKNMKYLDMVFKETLRKYPPAVALVRNSMEEYTFKGTNLTIPAKTRVFIPVFAIHRDENIYPEPQKFIPERFDPDTEKLRHQMNFLPFGDGPRNCIGARFAVYQSKLGIIKTIKNFEVKVSEKMKIPYQIDPKLVILTPVGGIHLKIKMLKAH